MPQSVDIQSEESFIVQFCPCGDTLCLTEAEYLELGGSQQQLDDIEAGIKLDAPILPSRVCAQCEADTAERDRRTEYMLSL